MKLHPSIKIERVEELARLQMFGTENPGICKACGNEQEGCEPDARNYVCEACDARQVFGAEELLREMC